MALPMYVNYDENRSDNDKDLGFLNPYNPMSGMLYSGSVANIVGNLPKATGNPVLGAGGKTGNVTLPANTTILGAGGNTSTLPTVAYGNSGRFTTSYDAGTLDALSKLMNPDPFTYNPETDPAFQAYKAQYELAGDRAFQNTIGELSTLTGGRLNSWATSGAAQARNYYAQQLGQMIPTLQENAYNKYKDNINTQFKQFETLRNMQDMEYKRNQDAATAEETAKKNETDAFKETINQYYSDYQAQINKIANDDDPSNDWQIPYLKAAREEKIATLKQEEEKKFKETINAYYSDFQAEINKIANDNDSSNDWKIPYLKAAREEKIAIMNETKAKEEADHRTNALEMFKYLGVANEYIAKWLGVKVGDKTANYNMEQMKVKIDQQNADTAAKNANIAASKSTSSNASDLNTAERAQFDDVKTQINNSIIPKNPITGQLEYPLNENVLQGIANYLNSLVKAGYSEKVLMQLAAFYGLAITEE